MGFINKNVGITRRGIFVNMRLFGGLMVFLPGLFKKDFFFFSSPFLTNTNRRPPPFELQIWVAQGSFAELHYCRRRRCRCRGSTWRWRPWIWICVRCRYRRVVTVLALVFNALRGVVPGWNVHMVHDFSFLCIFFFKQKLSFVSKMKQAEVCVFSNGSDLFCVSNLDY